MGRYLDLLRKADQGGACAQERQTANHQNLQNPDKGGFDGFVGRSEGTRADTRSAAGETPTGTAPPTRATGRLVHFSDREPLEVYFYPAADHAEVLVAYPGAVEAEPVPERTDTRTANLVERDELLALIQAVYSEDTDQERQQAFQAALADPGGALVCYRAIAAERGIRGGESVLALAPKESAAESAQKSAVWGCSMCRHRKRPGLSAGYCSVREDLPPAYTPGHPLRSLPADNGLTCTSYKTFED